MTAIQIQTFNFDLFISAKSYLFTLFPPQLPIVYINIRNEIFLILIRKDI